MLHGLPSRGPQRPGPERPGPGRAAHPMITDHDHDHESDDHDCQCYRLTRRNRSSGWALEVFAWVLGWDAVPDLYNMFLFQVMSAFDPSRLSDVNHFTTQLSENGFRSI